MTQPHPNTRKVHEDLETAGITAELQVLGEDVRTALAAANALGCEVGAIANSLVFIADGAPILVMTSGAHRVDERYFAENVGFSVLRRANAGEVREATGQPIGGVAPVGHPEPLLTYVDPELAKYPQLWMGGGAPNLIFPLTYEQLLLVTNGRVAAVNAG